MDKELFTIYFQDYKSIEKMDLKKDELIKDGWTFIAHIIQIPQ
jgi:hypothetical protein